MASRKLAKAQGTLLQNREAANKLAEGSGFDHVRKLLSDAQDGIEKRLAAIPGADAETFTQAQMRATLAQLKLVSRDLVVGMQGALESTAVAAAEQAAQHSLDYLLAADDAFRGVGVQPLAIREARMFASATEGARSSLLSRLASSGEPVKNADEKPHKAKVGILQRYGMETVSKFERQMQLGLLQRKSWGQMVDDITGESSFLQGAPRFWAERIVRTEAMGAYGRAAWETTREADEQLGDMVKILSAVFDDRTGSDSYAVHGQIRRPEEAFESWYGAFQHPPDRPNDRGIVVPHRISWEIPEYLDQREDEEVEARWDEEGHKLEMPERPLMSTVDLELFGKEAPPELRPQDEAAAEAAAQAGDVDVSGPNEMLNLRPAALPDTFQEEPEIAPEELAAAAAEAGELPEFDDVPAAERILARKYGDAKGSNKGGFYEGLDGVNRYVKFYRDDAQAYVEHLANQIYKALDVAVADSEVFADQDGKIAYASKIIEGGRTLGSTGIEKKAAKKVMNGFVGDVLTGNWDAVGLAHDNAMILPSGEVARIDNGGSLLFRAQGGRKPAGVLNAIGEWDKFFDKGTNPAYSKVAEAAGVTGPEDMKSSAVIQLQKLRNFLKTTSWDKFVEQHAAGLNDADKRQVVDMLKARTELLNKKYTELTRKKKKEPPVPIEADAADRLVYGEGGPLRDLRARIYKHMMGLQSRGDSTEFYTGIYSKANVSRSVRDQAHTWASNWTGEYRRDPTHLKLYKAMGKAMHDPQTADRDAGYVKILMETRKQRWRELMASMGEDASAKVPTHVEAYRGMKGHDGDWMQKVLEAWEDESKTHVGIQHHECASWSTRSEAARGFAGSNGIVVRKEWHMEREILMDQVLDDSSFITSFMGEAEVIAGTGKDGLLEVAKHDVKIRVRGVEYTHAQAKEARAAMEQAGLVRKKTP